MAAKYDEAGTALVTAAQSARFHRRMRGAAQATSSGPPEALPDGTLQRQEAEIAQLLWAEVQTVYPALGGLSCEDGHTRSPGGTGFWTWLIPFKWPRADLNAV